MKRISALALLLLAGCADDRYVATTGAPEQLDAVLHECKGQAVHAYLEHRSNGGMIAGALLGGAVGGVVGSLVDSGVSASGPDLSGPNGIDAAIERCMRERGYEGTSRG